MTLGRMFQLMLGTAGLRIGGAAIGLLTQLVLARVLKPDDLGTVFLTMSVAAIASLLVSGGYPNLALTQLPRLATLGLARGAQAFHGRFLKDFLVWNLVLICLVVLVVALVPLSPSFRLALIFGSATAAFSGLLRYNSAIANGFKHYAMAFVPDSLVRPALFLLIVLGALVVGIELSLWFVLTAYVAGNFIVVVGQAVAMGDERLHFSSWGRTRRRFSAIIRPRAGLMMITAGVATMSADIVTLVGGLVLPAGEIAVLGICIRLAGLAGYVLQASQQFMLPDMTRAVVLRDEVQFRHLALRLNILMFGATLGVLVSTILFGQFFLGLFGSSYRAGYWLLVICMGAQSIRALAGMNQGILAIEGHQARSALAALTGIVIFISMAIILGGRLGVTGIGLAIVVAEVAGGLMLAAQAQSLTGRRADLLWLFCHSA